MKTLKSTILFVLLIAAFVSPTAHANLLTDPGFEANPLTTDFNVLNNFVGYQGQWGQELSTITGVDGGVTPAQGAKMLRMAYTGGVTTQAFQTIDVTSSAAVIDAGSATINLNALFTTGPNLSGALAGVYVSFFTLSNYGSITSTIGNTLNLDNSANTWQPISVNGAIPVGTRWLLAQVAYANVSLLSSDGTVNPGYVDAADLTLVPEPATLGLLTLGALALRRRK
jgi:hypothetical protein